MKDRNTVRGPAVVSSSTSRPERKRLGTTKPSSNTGLPT